MDEKSPLSQEELEKIANYAGKYSLTKEEAQAMVAEQESLYRRGHKVAEDEYTNRIQSMRTAMNAHPDFSAEKKPATMAAISKAVQVFGSPKLVESLKNPEFGYDLEIAMMLKQIGEALGPEILPGQGTGGPAAPTMDPERARLMKAYPELQWEEKK